jgi:protein SCO1/2
MEAVDMNTRSLARAALAVLLATGLTGCKQREVYYVQGVVEELKPEQKQVRIHHEEIPNYMAAMTMDFDVRTTNELGGLIPGDTISFRLIVLEDDAWIDRIVKLSNAPPAVKSRPLFREVREVQPLKPGDRVPDYRLTNELGQAVTLSQFKGQALAITFIFTRCPLPTFCPRMSGNFAEARKQLKSLPHAPTNWHFLTISFDPEFDTPQVLRAYAKQCRIGSDGWDFLTGELIDITALGEQVGLTFWRPEPNEPANISHNVRTLVVDPQGRLQRVFEGNEWKPDELVAEVVQAAAVKP